MKLLFLSFAFFYSFSFAQNSNLQMGDYYYALRAENSHGNMANSKNAKEAIKYYALALKNPKEREEAAWKLLRAYYYLGCFSMPETKDREIFFGKAKKEGKAFLMEFPKNSEIAYWYSIDLALWAITVSPLKAFYAGTIKETREIAQKLIAEEKNGDSISAARGYQIMGRAHQKIPRVIVALNWIKKDSAEYYFKKSLELNPQDLATRLFLAEYYKETGRRREAEALLAPALKRKPRPEEYLEDERNLIRMRSLLSGP